jgi:hypothetical protein
MLLIKGEIPIKSFSGLSVGSNATEKKSTGNEFTFNVAG